MNQSKTCGVILIKMRNIKDSIENFVRRKYASCYPIEFSIFTDHDVGFIF